MQVELLELREDRIRFLLTGADMAFANAVRRACLAEVPKLAIDEISIYDNTSVLFDEQLSLRLGLVPIAADQPEVFATPDQCECGGAGCPGCHIDFTLSREGPGTVYSSDIKFSDSSVKPAFESIPLAVLGEGEKIVVDGFATKRTGFAHSKWNSGTQCGYKNLPKIEIINCKGCGSCVKVCPRGVLALDESDMVKVVDPTNCSLCKLCIKECDSGGITVTPIPDAFVMTISSDGSIKAKELVSRAAAEVKRRADELSAKLAELS